MFEGYLNYGVSLAYDLIRYILGTLAHNAISLGLGILIASAMRVYIDADRMRTWLMDRARLSIPATVAFGALTPFCACGTMAVALSMMTAALPWGAVMAFLTSSPLMSSEDFILVSGILGRHFALSLLVASIALGLGAGYMTHLLEKHTGFLRDQHRFNGSATGLATAIKSCGCDCHCADGETALEPDAQKERGLSSLKVLVDTIWQVGLMQILPLFSLFAGIGYLINRFVPTQMIMALFSGSNPFAVPIAAIIGLPLYVSGAGAVSLIKSLMAGGATGGAMLAFMITGPGTSAGVIAGITTVMKRRAVFLYTVYILTGGVLAGLIYNAVTR